MPALAPPKVVSLILAAGQAVRFGAAKQLQVLEGEPLARRCALAALACELDVFVVIGAHGHEVGRSLDGLALRRVEHRGWSAGIGSSIAFGVRQILRAATEVDGVLIQLADQALVEPADLKRLADAFYRFPQSIVAAAYNHTVGAPCIFPARSFPKLLALTGDRGAKPLLSAAGEHLITVELPRAALDIDTPQDLQRAAGMFRIS